MPGEGSPETPASRHTEKGSRLYPRKAVSPRLGTTIMAGGRGSQASAGSGRRRRSEFWPLKKGGGVLLNLSQPPHLPPDAPSPPQVAQGTSGPLHSAQTPPPHPQRSTSIRSQRTDANHSRGDCVTLGSLFSLSKPQFTHLRNGDLSVHARVHTPHLTLLCMGT